MSAVPAENATGEFEFCEADFERVRRLIYSQAGISLSTSKRQLVYSRLGRRLRTLGLSNFGDYLDALESGGADEWEAFTNALTIIFPFWRNTSPVRLRSALRFSGVPPVPPVKSRIRWR